MKAKIITVVFLVLTPFFMMGCASTRPVFHNGDNGVKAVFSEAKLKKTDFTGTDFFVKNIPNAYISDFNELVFSYIKDNYEKTDDDFFAYGPEYEKPPYNFKEWILISEDKKNADQYPETKLFDVEYIKANKKGDHVYYFGLVVTDGKSFADALDYIKELFDYKSRFSKEIEDYKWTIENCSSQTIQKSRVVSVPRQVQEKVWNPGSIGHSSNSSFGSSQGDEGHWEVYTKTVYVDEVQYYNVANPNYNPQAVSTARAMLTESQEKLQFVNNELIRVIDSLWDVLPFDIFKYDKD